MNRTYKKIQIKKNTRLDLKDRKTISLSKETNEIQRVVALRNVRNKRFHFREFIIEGVASIEQAFENGWKIRALFYNRDIQLSDWAKKILGHPQVQETYAITHGLMKMISDREDLPELLLIGKVRLLDFSIYQPTKKSEVIAVLDRPKSAGNLGMIIRSAAAFGVSGIVLSGHSADEYDPKCIRASVGSFFSMPIYHVDGISKFMEKIEQLRVSAKDTLLLATGNQGTRELEQVDFSADVVFLVLGNETLGVSRGYREMASDFLKISLASENFTSLNIAAAASIFFYAIHMQQKNLPKR